MTFISPWIHTTNKCNCNCSYCDIVDDNIDMSSEIIYKLNDIIFGNDILFVKYRLSGGEPLLVIDGWFEPVKAFLDKIEHRGGVEILSNFTVYPDKLDFLLRHNCYCNINVSLDSLSQSKPFKNGKSSAVSVLSNIDKFKRMHNSTPFIMTVITENGKYLPELAEYITDIKAKWEIQLNKYYDARTDTDQINYNIMKVLDVFEKKSYSINNLLYNFCDLETERICTNGRTMFAIMPSGDILNCQMQPIAIGNIYKDNLLDILSQNESFKINRNDGCKMCIIQEYCHGDCPNNSSDLRRIKSVCETMKPYVLRALKIKLKELNYAKSLYA